MFKQMLANQVNAFDQAFAWLAFAFFLLLFIWSQAKA